MLVFGGDDDDQDNDVDIQLQHMHVCVEYTWYSQPFVLSIVCICLSFHLQMQ